MINSRDLNDLQPLVRDMAVAFLAATKQEGIDVLVTSTYRDAESQAAIYAIGRTVKGPNPSILKPMGRVVTNAKPGDSYHNWRVAFDWVPLVGGKPVWNDTKLFEKCGAIAESVGLEWAGRWTTFPELAHCQYRGGLQLADFKLGKTLEATA